MKRTPPAHNARTGDDHTAAVLALARREVEQRHVAAAIQDAERQRRWGWATVGIGMGVLLGMLVWPTGTLADRLRWIMRGICDQQHNLSFSPVMLPLDARCTGIYSAFLATLVMLVASGRIQATKLPPRTMLAVLSATMVFMGIDGVNSLLSHSGANLYPPHNALRLATGLGCGMALALCGLPLFNMGLRRTSHSHQRSLDAWPALGRLTGIVVGIGVLAWMAPAWIFYPLAIFSVLGGVTGLALVNLWIIRLWRGVERPVLLVAQLAQPAALSLLLTVTELTLLAWARGALEGVGSF